MGAISSNPDAPLRPVAASERIETMDVLRGFALVGILLMNIEGMAGPLFQSFSGLDPALTGVDRTADALIYILVQGKFYTLFSLLFGMGFAVMSTRAEARGQPFAGVYWRRSLVLLVIGVIHGLLIWSGDILLMYALLSFFLLAFRNVPAKWLPWIAGLTYLASSGMMLLLGLVGSAMQMDPAAGANWNSEMAKAGAEMNAMLEAQRSAYGSGTYLEAVIQRARDVGFMLSNLLFIGPTVFGMFLFGTWFVKSGAIAAPDRFPRLFAFLRWGALPLGLALMLLSFWMEPTADFNNINLHASLAFVASSVGSVLMAFGYVGWIVKGVQSAATAPLLHWLAPAGRMALSNYLMQSIVCTLIFNGYGFGYLDQLPRAWQVVFVFTLFLIQVLYSRWWLARFRFGPAEWVWRSLTYLRPQPMRASPASA
ncbi:DUF418 domain-containing protein [Pseudoxanthomonas sp. 22568]|uniref:DUF418 domain-containing protein n=1 Tax=Pseudoxanthomonas sp. 22568 TaxID=3453945 RepID=UPI003F83E797